MRSGCREFPYMRLATREEILSVWWGCLAAAPTDHDFAIGYHIGYAGQVAVSDRIGDAFAGRPLHRTTNNDVGGLARRQDTNVKAVRLGGIAGCDGNRLSRRYPANRADETELTQHAAW